MDRSPLRNPDKAIFAVRKVVQLHPPIYQRRGMACAVDMGKEQYLLTWEGVFNEDDRDLINEKSVKFNRRSKTFSTMDLEISKIKQAGSCSFISVDKGLQHGDALTVEIPGSDVTTNDVCAQSFVGRNKSLTINFKYNQKKGRHELVSFKGKDCAIEKSDVLGSPIISNKCVIGVVGEDDNRRIIPYFISRTELGELKCFMTLRLEDICFILSTLPISILQGL
ncbi:uncharacterized protein LOC111346926 [Stylophora pistillata]|uniref:uncharacterized protein LOC111346926 n=1 Tax=Stylophora pistillata TaxID=50429 RepID=UPI000C0549CE|nr:uncharacterized protein LOC111346926 [Stylophora pistillata]